MSNRIGMQVIELKDLIVNNQDRFGHAQWLELGTLTNQFDLVGGHPRLLRSLQFGDDDYEVCVMAVLRTMLESHPDAYGIISDYVRSKCQASGDNISSHGEERRRIVFVPGVFKVPEEPLEPNLVSVMMPFDASFSPVYQAIKDAVADVGLRCQRADDIWDDTTVIQDVFSLIFRSYIVVCDFSSRNANVFYEAGVAHTLGKHVVPLVQSLSDVPFDLRHHRCLMYLNNSEGRQTLRDQLAARLQTLIDRRPSGR